MNNNLKIIAEAGINHNGDINKAFSLIDKAKEAGASFVKFQTFIPKNLVTKYAETVTYQKKTSKESYQLNLLSKNCLNFSQFKQLYSYSKKIGINLLSSPFDEQSLNFLLKLKLDYIKIPSGEITNYFLLKKLSKYKIKVILSTGMSHYNEIKEAVSILISGKLNIEDIIILHCISNYPTSIDDVNLNNMLTLKKKFKTQIGFSDHTLDSTSSEIAVALGAQFIEKHITLDKRLKGPDHKISLSPREFKYFVKKLNNVCTILGYSNRILSINEKENRNKSRKSLVAKKNIKKNEKFSFINLTAKRPGYGVSPMHIKKIFNKKSKRDYHYDEIIKKDELS